MSRISKAMNNGAVFLALWVVNLSISSAQVAVDYMEYPSDSAAQAAYVSSDSEHMQCYSESDLNYRTQGNYSMRVVADADSLNDTLARTVSPTIDLSDQDIVKIDIRPTKIRTSVQLRLHNANGHTESKDITVEPTLLWKKPYTGYVDTFSQPLYENGIVYFNSEVF